MLSAAADLVQSLGGISLSLCVHPTNSAAFKFYDSHGYIESRRLDGQWSASTRLYKTFRAGGGKLALPSAPTSARRCGAGGKPVLPSGGKLSRSGKDRQATHQAAIKDRHKDFQCGCALAASQGQSSCLAQFTQIHLQDWHNETYRNGLSKDCIFDILHARVWTLRVAIPAGASMNGPKVVYSIPHWYLNGQVKVCKAAWLEAYGVPERMLRAVVSMVRRGLSPASSSATTSARQQLTKLVNHLDRVGRQKTERREFATQWWVKYLSSTQPAIEPSGSNCSSLIDCHLF